MDTIVADPFFQGMHADVFGCASLEELFAVKDEQAYLDFELGRCDERTLCETYFLPAERRRREQAGLAPDVDPDAAKAYLRAHLRFVDDPPGARRENSFGMESLLREIRARCAGCEVHAFSNYGPWWTVVEETMRLSRFLQWSFVSCETGLRKPDRAAYAHALAVLGLEDEPGRAIFVDDSATNCAAAKAMGIDAIHFTGGARGVTDLRAALIARGFQELVV